MFCFSFTDISIGYLDFCIGEFLSYSCIYFEDVGSCAPFFIQHIILKLIVDIRLHPRLYADVRAILGCDECSYQCIEVSLHISILSSGEEGRYLMVPLCIYALHNILSRIMGVDCISHSNCRMLNRYCPERYFRKLFTT